MGLLCISGTTVRWVMLPLCRGPPNDLVSVASMSSDRAGMHVRSWAMEAQVCQAFKAVAHLLDTVVGESIKVERGQLSGQWSL